MTNQFTSEEMKVMKPIIRMELEENERELKGLCLTPANSSRIRYLIGRIETLKSILSKM